MIKGIREGRDQVVKQEMNMLMVGVNKKATLLIKLMIILTMVPTVQRSFGAAQQKRSNIDGRALLEIIKSRSVHRNVVDWIDLEPKLDARLDKAGSDDEVLRAFVFLFRQMNDVHSGMFHKNKHYGYYKAVDDETARLLRPLIDLERAQSGKIKSTLVANKFGYLLIPSIQAATEDEVNRYAQIIQGEICRLEKNAPRAWIVDLRLNGGGNMKPMLAGVNNFLGSGIIGGFVNSDDKLVTRWSLRNGNLYLGKTSVTSIKDRCLAKYERVPVVVLIGPITKSSGEASAIAFKHRANTYFIGEPTAEGYTTANEWIPISKDLVLNLATAYMADRKGVAYRARVLPDLVVMGGDSFDNLAADKKVQAAIDLLNEKTVPQQRWRIQPPR